VGNQDFTSLRAAALPGLIWNHSAQLNFRWVSAGDNWGRGECKQPEIYIQK